MSKSVKNLLANLNDERNAVFTYQALAEIEKDPRISEVYRRMAEAEARHASAWQKRLEEQGLSVPPFRPAWRERALLWLARRFGPSFVLPSIAGIERQASRSLKNSPLLSREEPGLSSSPPLPAEELGVNSSPLLSREESGLGSSPPLPAEELGVNSSPLLSGEGLGVRLEIKSMAAEETSHARLLTLIAQTAPRGVEGGLLARLEGRHRSAGGNALRAAVLGANDGLVSNLSLVMGVAGAELSSQSILITGLAGLLAGAFSMALGEWLSVQSSRELYQRQIEIETEEIEFAPEEEAEELALIYQSRGIDPGQARQMAQRVLEDPAGALEALSREELGIDPKELGGSAWEAAVTSFILFAAGAVIPVLPFLFARGLMAVYLSLLISTLGLFLIGAGITLFTGRPLAWSGARQVLFGLVAAAVTFGLGRLIGVSLGG